MKPRAVEADSALVTALKTGMAEYLQMRADGVPRDQAVAGLELLLRDTLPKGRREPWHCLCDRCEDTGYVWVTCEPFTRCGRERCERHPESRHPYVRRCVCAKGLALEPKPKGGMQDVIAAGKVAEKKAWSRPGR